MGVKIPKTGEEVRRLREAGAVGICWRCCRYWGFEPTPGLPQCECPEAQAVIVTDEELREAFGDNAKAIEAWHRLARLVGSEPRPPGKE